MKKIAIATDRQAPQGSVFPFWQNYVNEGYTNAIFNAGAIPLLIPFTNPTGTEQLLDGFDALVVTGGNDIDPILYGEEVTYSKEYDERVDRFHMGLITAARKKGIPILGICRGLQLLNVALGGTLYQDIGKEREDSINHQIIERPLEIVHNVELTEGTYLYYALKEKHLGVNSLHHQGIKELGFGLKAAAYAPDGLIEAIEGQGVYGVQWHPEALSEGRENLFNAFVKDILNA